MIVGFPPGGAVDYLARQVAGALGPALGQQFIVENRPGATGAIASAEAARAAPDGYTFLFPLDSHALNHLTNPKLSYDTFSAFDYLSLLVTLPQVLVVPADSPFQSFTDLLAGLQKGPLTYGTTGVASAAHLNVLRLLRSQRVEATHVPYKGSAPMVTDVLGGHLDFASAGLSVALPHLKAGKLRALAVSSLRRSPLFPNVPAIAETVPGHDVTSWIGLAAPANLPTAIRNKVIAASNAALRAPAMRQALEEQSFTVVTSSPEDFAKRVRSDAAVVQELIASKVLVLTE
jgi:tripartite-type tricarboxylate transporter receptor subunit TctC